MNAYTIFKANANSYLFNSQKRDLLNIHPIVELIHEYCTNTNNTLSLFEYVLEVYPAILKDEFEIYKDKYNLLQKRGYFESYNVSAKLSGQITAEVVKTQLANLDSVLFQVTSGCNLSCKYCCYGDIYNRAGDSSENSKEMSFSTVEKFFEYIVPFWNSCSNTGVENRIMIGFYGGEPLLNFKLIKRIVEYTKTILIKNPTIFTFNMTTNAVLLDKYADFLVENKFNLLISLDGDEKADSLRVYKNNKPSFQQVFLNVKNLQERYPDYFNEHVQFNSVLNNNSSALSVIKFIKTQFNKIPLIEPISTTELLSDKIDTFRKIAAPYIETEEIMHELGSRSQRLKRIGYFFYYNLNNAYKHYADVLYFDSSSQKKIPTGTCLPFYKKLYITAENKIYVCERIGAQHVMGTIDDQVTIDYDYVAKIYSHYFSTIKKQCERCYMADTCSECLFQLKFINNQPQCPYQITESQFKIYLANLISSLESNPDMFNLINKMVTSA